MRRAEATWHIGMESLSLAAALKARVCPNRQATKVGQYNVNTVKMLQGIYKTTSKKKTNHPVQRKAPGTKVLCQAEPTEQTLWMVAGILSRAGAISRTVPLP